MNDAGIFGTDYMPLPFARAVIDERGLIAVVGSGSSGAGERGVYDDGIAIAEKIGNTQAVAGGKAVNFGGSPGLSGSEPGRRTLTKPIEFLASLLNSLARTISLPITTPQLIIQDWPVARMWRCQPGVLIPDKFAHAAWRGR